MRRRDFLAAVSAFAAPAKVERWVIIAIGNLSRNLYWGEPDTKPLRSAICTTTLIGGGGFHLLVDPSLVDRDAMAKELDRRSGLRLDDVTAVFITHEHGDHYAGIGHFTKAAWYAAAPVAEILNGRKTLARAIQPSPASLFGAVDVIPTPGHTRSHHALRFDCDSTSVVAAGDSVATRDFWRERRSYYNAVDPALAARTMDKLAAIASVIIPGHDNYFNV
jgi:glyoxylase-like metal-dependent hydrolase (beta-lactamase superfamily II)